MQAHESTGFFHLLRPLFHHHYHQLLSQKYDAKCPCIGRVVQQSEFTILLDIGKRSIAEMNASESRVILKPGEYDQIRSVK